MSRTEYNFLPLPGLQKTEGEGLIGTAQVFQLRQGQYLLIFEYKLANLLAVCRHLNVLIINPKILNPTSSGHIVQKAHEAHSIVEQSNKISRQSYIQKPII